MNNDTHAAGFTAEDAKRDEAHSMIDALCDGSLELNDDFLTRYAGETVKRELMRLDSERDRAFALDGAIDEASAYFPGGIASLDDDCFWLPCNEIAIQFEGSAAEFFADVSDWHISGDCAYLYTGYGLCLPVNVPALREAVNDMLTD